MVGETTRCSQFELDLRSVVEGDECFEGNFEEQRPQCLITISDDEDGKQIELPRRRRSRQPQVYFIHLLNISVDLNISQSWAECNNIPNIQYIFDAMKSHYWKNQLKPETYTVCFDDFFIYIKDGSSFKIDRFNRVFICRAAVMRPRLQLISLVLHILTHIFLRKATKLETMLTSHDTNFRQIMLFFNEKLGAQITTCHKFNYSEDEIEYASQWYQCTGKCSRNEPFRGVIRSENIPDGSRRSSHDRDCNGKFFKILEATKEVVNENRRTDKKFLRHLFVPIPQIESNPSHRSTRIQPRELIEIADDEEDTPVVSKNLYEVVDLSEEEYDYELQHSLESPKKLASSFIGQGDEVFQRCPFCDFELTKKSPFDRHFETCRGRALF